MYVGPERRNTDPSPSPPGDNNGRWEWLHTCLESLSAKVDANHLSLIDVRQELLATKRSLVEHVEEEMHMYNAALEGFPNKDPISNKHYHEQLINESEVRTKFWADMRTELGKYTLKGLIVVMTALVVYYWNGHIPRP
jgi:hypothetical protein